MTLITPEKFWNESTLEDQRALLKKYSQLPDFARTSAYDLLPIGVKIAICQYVQLHIIH